MKNNSIKTMFLSLLVMALLGSLFPPIKIGYSAFNISANSIDIHEKNRVNYTTHIGNNYYIPLSCLISNSIDNLLTAGKSLSADRYAFAAVRVMPPCIAMGEAAGVTAALAAIKGIAAGDVPHEEVQKILIDNGAYLE